MTIREWEILRLCVNYVIPNLDDFLDTYEDCYPSQKNKDRWEYMSELEKQRYVLPNEQELDKLI